MSTFIRSEQYHFQTVDFLKQLILNNKYFIITKLFYENLLNAIIYVHTIHNCLY